MAAATAAAVIATAVVVTAAIVAAAFAATSVAAAAVSRMKLFGSGVAHGDDFAFEAYVVVDEGVIEVHLDMGRSDFGHKTLDAVAVGCEHRQAFADLDVLAVKLAVDLEDLALDLDDMLGVVTAESLVGLGDDVIGVAGSQALESDLERTDDALRHAIDDCLGLFVRGLMNQSLFTVGVNGIKVVAELDIFSGFYLFHNLNLGFDS